MNKSGSSTVFAKTATQARQRAYKLLTTIGLKNVAITAAYRQTKRASPKSKEYVYSVDWDTE